MRFRVSEKAIKKEKRRSIYQIVLLTLGLSFISLFDTEYLVLGIFLLLFLIYEAYRDLKNMKLISLEIIDEGICFDNNEIKQVLPFERINRIKVAKKDGEIKKYIIVTETSKEDDISSFEKIEKIDLELKKYLGEDSWEFNILK